MTETKQVEYPPEFVERLLALIDRYDAHEDIYWRTGPQYGGGTFAKPASFFVNCNDLFWWGTADLEEVTPENIYVLEKAYEDCKLAEPVVGTIWGSSLFCARVRGMRPQGAAYTEYPAIRELFDRAGPERSAGAGNPREHPLKQAREKRLNELNRRIDSALKSIHMLQDERDKINAAGETEGKEESK